ncbi:DUF6415 family natural product biosynthesis protein [Streptomyces cucumeris]|uniref:DUF6415 family natural product biosynthesis protein n=1 Tax=Streptomyces cucumeris TaxID=2962890 RepID=UPI003D73ED65
MGTDNALQAAVDVDRITPAINRALAAQTTPPPCGELVELRQTLQGHIQGLLPLVERQVELMDRATVAWYERRCRLNTLSRKAAQGLSAGVQPTHEHLRSLAYACAFLLENSGLIQEPAQ